MIRINVRGYGDNVLRFVDWLKIEPETIEAEIPKLVDRHMLMLAKYKKQLVEIEFPDEPNPEERFYRIGNDPDGMVKPMRVI